MTQIVGTRIASRRLTRLCLGLCALVVGAGLSGGCGRDGVLEFRLLAPLGQDPFAGATTARLTLNTQPPLVREFAIQSDGTLDGSIKPAPTNIAPTIRVELLNARGEITAWGATPEVPLAASISGYVEILVGRVNQFAALPTGGAGGGVAQEEPVVQLHRVRVEPHERLALFFLRGLGRAFGGRLFTLGQRDAKAPCEVSHRVDERAPFQLHDEGNHIAARATPEAVKQAQPGMDGERRRLFLMKRTQTRVSHARFLERNAFAHDLQNVRTFANFQDFFIRNSEAHRAAPRPKASGGL